MQCRRRAWLISSPSKTLLFPESKKIFLLIRCSNCYCSGARSLSTTKYITSSIFFSFLFMSSSSSVKEISVVSRHCVCVCPFILLLSFTKEKVVRDPILVKHVDGRSIASCNLRVNDTGSFCYLLSAHMLCRSTTLLQNRQPATVKNWPQCCNSRLCLPGALSPPICHIRARLWH